MFRCTLVTMTLILLGGPLLAATKEQEAQMALETLKNGKDAKTRAEAAMKIGQMGKLKASLAKPAIPVLFDALKDKDSKVRAAAAWALGQADADADKTIKLLIDILKDKKETEEVKIGAIRGLSEYGNKANSALSVLGEISKDKEAKKLAGEARKAAKFIRSNK